ncbi:restriction endonuclease [bacterium]|nr:restriction endonuclease [bacterium]
MNYPGIRIEGAILSPDILDRLEELPFQKPKDFNLHSNSKVKDEIARAWADAQDYWRIFQRKLEYSKDGSPATSETRDHWIVPLLGLLGYQLEYQPRGIELNDKNYRISHRAVNRGQVPVHIIGYNESAGLDKKSEKAHLKMSAHAMLQEFLNLRDELYGVVTNGRFLRLLRDSSRLIKLTYLEFDLDRIFTDNLFADFAILFRLLHVTRLPVSDDLAPESIIEKYHQDSLDSGARIREGLSNAVKDSILAFANGFLGHPENDTLRNEAINGELSSEHYYRQLLQLIYRILFLMVIEERDLVFPDSTPLKHRNMYMRFYSVNRLRRLSEKRYLADRRKHDHWLSLLATFKLFEANGPGEKISVHPLDGELFGPSAIPDLRACILGNDVLLKCLRSLGLYQHPDTGQIIRVNYAALNVEEFGSVYEGLLEFEPVFIKDGGSQVQFEFSAGSERSATGSHYTPDDLVQPLLKNSLDYLIAEKSKQPDPEGALLSLKVADIACGSGHILLAAARRIATELAIIRTGEEQPTPSTFRIAIRDVIRSCIYGVDLNPLAVELCKVALWLEAHSPGQPLSFLDHRIKCGNSIVGFVHRDELEKGIPDEAFVTMTGDDKAIAGLFRKTNKSERTQKAQTTLKLAPEIQKQLDDMVTRWRGFSVLPDSNPEEYEAKKQRFLDVTNSRDVWKLNQLAAFPIGQFYIPKTPENKTKITTDRKYREYLSGEVISNSQAAANSLAIAMKKRFFHWFLEFPEVIQNGGFDCILGNPPYLGNRSIKRTYGESFLNYVKWEYSPAGSVDLVTYFLRRVYALLKHQGFLALLATNTIAQGSAREGGLEVVRKSGGTIVYAVRSMRWPGQASVEISIMSIVKGNWLGDYILDGNRVEKITTYLDSGEASQAPVPLAENKDKSFQGSIVLGQGFILDEEKAKSLIGSLSNADKVIQTYLNGSDLNSHPMQSASRWIINLYDWEEDFIRLNYSEVYDIIKRKVKPERTRVDEEGNFVLRKPLPQRWWHYADKRPKLYSLIKEMERVLVVAQVSRTVAFAFVPTGQVLDAKLIVFPFSDAKYFAILQSSLHYHWAWRYCTTMKSDLSYVPSKIFTPFPFPMFSDSITSKLNYIGEKYNSHRAATMQSLWVGLTKLYNLFHTSDLTPELISKVSKKNNEIAASGYLNIFELRRLHVEMDQEVINSYGWNDIELEHDFYEVEYLPENNRVCYTISSKARKEILKRLLKLNLERSAHEESEQIPLSIAEEVPLPDPDEISLDEFVSGAYPSSATDNSMIQIASAIISQKDGVESNRHLDMMLLASHPDWCRRLLSPKDQTIFNRVRHSVDSSVYVRPGQSIQWRRCLNYLEQQQVFSVDRTSSGHRIDRGVKYDEFIEAGDPDISNLVRFAINAATRLEEIRTNILLATEAEQAVVELIQKLQDFEYSRTG